MKFQPKDIVAILVIIVAATLLFRGIDDTVAWTLVAVVCAYYGIDLTPFVKLGRNQSKKNEDKDGE